MSEGTKLNIDEDLYSRQLSLYGKEMLLKVFESNVLISGLNGLGAEIAKNVVFGGVKSVTLHDESFVRNTDTCSNFLLDKKSVGTNRGEACIEKLREYNPHVTVSAISNLTKEDLAKYKVVVFTDLDWDTAKEYDNFCYTQNPPIAFILSEVHGLFSRIFCNFGPRFTILDVDGEETPVGTFKKHEVLQFKPLEEALGTHLDFLVDKCKTLKEASAAEVDLLLDECRNKLLLHCAFEAMDILKCSLRHAHDYKCTIDVQNMIHTIEIKLKDNYHVKNHDLLGHFVAGYNIVLNPMAAVVGGIVGEEVMKACSAHFKPIFQLLYFESVKSLPVKPLDAADKIPKNDRYDPQRRIFGNKLQEKLANANVFMVGSGALGCEFLKNLALMGVSCGSGMLSVTDDDVVRNNNLSHQLLFRKDNISSSKAKVACLAASLINSNLNTEPHEIRASSKTEDIFGDSFWERQNVVINAVDNVDSRMYIDSRCVYFEKPMLESGKLGTKCNTQMIIPHLSENYGASRDPPENYEAAAFRIESFPCSINHCLTFAQTEFEELFNNSPIQVNNYLKDKAKYKFDSQTFRDAHAFLSLVRILDLLDGSFTSFEDCVHWARLKFEYYFVNRVKVLVHSYKIDAKRIDGSPIWSPSSCFPTELRFSPINKDHMSFITAAACLRAQCCGIPCHNWEETIKRCVGLTEIMPLQLNETIEVDTGTPEPVTNIKEEEMEEVLKMLDTKFESVGANFVMTPILLEMDDEKNHHTDFIAAFANLRATNYNIPGIEKLKAKQIVGQITPATVSSTAVATGLVCLELYKLFHEDRLLCDYRNTFVNLSLPLVLVSEPVKAKEVHHNGRKWTVWDKWQLRGNPTLGDLLSWLKREKGIDVVAISCNNKNLYTYLSVDHMKRKKYKVVDLVKGANIEIPEGRKYVDLAVVASVDCPRILVWFDDSGLEKVGGSDIAQGKRKLVSFMLSKKKKKMEVLNRR